MHFTVSSHSKSIITVMSFLPADITLSLRGACPAVTQLTKSCLKSNISLQLKMRVLITKLDSLLLLENAELYHNN